MQAASERAAVSQADAWSSAHEATVRKAAAERAAVGQADAWSSAHDATVRVVNTELRRQQEAEVEARKYYTMWEEQAPARA